VNDAKAVGPDMTAQWLGHGCDDPAALIASQWTRSIWPPRDQFVPRTVSIGLQQFIGGE
jgi:hypothetical protein